MTDAIGRIAETVQQIAAATAQQARGSELIMKSAEKIRLITQHVEKSSQEQARGGHKLTTTLESVSLVVTQLGQSQKLQTEATKIASAAAAKAVENLRAQETALRKANSVVDKLRT